MMTRIAGICVCLVALAVTASGQMDHTDNQQWTDVQVFIPVTKQIDFTVGGTLRLGRDFNRPVDERVGAGFSFKLGRYVTVSPNYQHIGMQPFAGRRIWENRLSVPVQLRFDVGQFRLTHRNLFERRLRNSGVKTSRYRQRLQIEHPVGPDGLALSVYVADEVFYDWAIDRWVRNRFYVGAIKVFNKHFTQDIFYTRQNDGVSIPGDLNVIGTTLRFRL
jgi:uncharacterized protein DUF2490